MKKYLIALLFSFVVLSVPALAQTPTPAPDHFVISTTGGTFNGSPVTIATLGAQLTKGGGVSIAYKYLFDPTDGTKPHVGTGVTNYTFCLCSVVPKAIKSKLAIDLTNYNLTLQAGAGVESLSNGVGLRSRHIVGDFGVSPSYPLPGGHVQVAPLFSWVIGAGRVNKVKGGSINFTF